MQHQNTDSCWGWCSPPTPTSQITEIGRVTHCSSALPTSYQVKQTILSGGPQWPTHLSSRSPTRSALSKHTQPTPAVPVKQLAYQKAVERGWSGHWPAIDALVAHESGWIVGKWNTSGSGACGLGQALPCSKMGNAYGNPEGEIDWTYNYIASRYGNPSNAWAFWNCIGQCGATYKTATWY
jgi:hypothetical protein